jgi:hypothetical protein
MTSLVEAAIDLLEFGAEILPGKIFLWLLLILIIGGLIYWLI